MEGKSKVVVIPCDKYDEEKVYTCLKAGIKELGGMESFVKPDENILVKPNFLSPADPDKALVTHPTVTRAVLRLLSEMGCTHVKYGDSPGSGTSKAAAARVNLTPENTFGAELAEMSEEELTEFKDGLTCKEFYFAKEVTQADAIINVCKMKTHALERITGAVKNVYGLICGLRKAAGHVSYPNATIFARMLCDIHRCVKPRLHIMDGIVAMEGNGPAAGTSVNMNVLLASTDPVALDTVFCYMVDLNPDLVPTCSQGTNIGIGTDREEDIEIVLVEGSNCESLTKSQLFYRFGNPSFDVAREKPRGSMLGRFSTVMTKFARRPYIDKEKCVKCGICVEHCPVVDKAVNFRNGKDNPPEYDYSKCIRCYCCQEMCPQHAIKVKGKISQ